MNKKDIVINTLIFFISSFFFLLIGEAVLRIIKPAPEVVVVDIDPFLGYGKSRDKGYDTNGWRNEQVPSRVDMVAIGDSMVEGLGVVSRDDAWPQVLSRLASASIYQMAKGGSGAVQYAHIAERSTALKPKIALVGLTVGNDLYDAYDSAYHLDAWKDIRDPSLNIPDEPLLDGDIRTSVLAAAPVGSWSYKIFTLRLWLRGHVRIYALLGDASRELREQLGLANTEGEKLDKVAELAKIDPGIAYVYDKNPAIQTILSPEYRYAAVNLDDPRTKEGWRITKELFLKMEKSYGTTTAMVLVEIPTKEWVYLSMMRKTDGAIPPQFEAYEKKENEVAAAFKAFCLENHLRCFSLREPMTDALVSGRPIYKPIMDGHPPEEGYRMIAEAIYKYLLDERLLPIIEES